MLSLDAGFMYGAICRWRYYTATNHAYTENNVNMSTMAETMSHLVTYCAASGLPHRVCKP
ncbi:hypothetical protein [Candidatus Amarolinea dominans]|uniref:hypothetical protein n=1 Tax=Candidatus Amarolinea dominans TaxID=3140696 RepID=UPI0031CC64AE